MRAAWGRGNVALGVFIDLKKAFDTVNHAILLAKLEHYGVREGALGLLASYSRGREQYVVYGGVESGRSRVECGVPQGSVLGPLFFLLYVNDMVRVSGDLGFVLFADDTNLFAEAGDPDSLVTRVNGELAKLEVWFRCNRLTLNLKKTEFVYFSVPGGRGNLPGQVEVGGVGIEERASVRFLGSRWTGRLSGMAT